jgi:hypothetical protein
LDEATGGSMLSLEEKLFPSLGMQLDNLGNTYVQFINSDKKVQRLALLSSMRLIALDVHSLSRSILEALTSKLDTPDPEINLGLKQRVATVTGGNIHFQILNLDHLVKTFTTESNVRNKIQYLYRIYELASNIADVALITSAEPDDNTERA